MRRSLFALALVILPLIAGCGGSFSLFLSIGDETPGSLAVASDPVTDGDVRSDGLVTAGGEIFSGFDPSVPPPAPEYRGFLSFPIDAIPVGSPVDSATVTLFVDRIDLLAGSGDVFLDFDHVRYGSTLSFSAFSAFGVPVGSVSAGVRLLPSAGPQQVSFDVVTELQMDLDNPSAAFFQLRISGTGGLAQIVDGAGNRGGGLPPDPGLFPVLDIRFRF
jgi:hypothetical protein